MFFITALFIGVLFSAPAFIESNVELKDNGMFSNTNVIATDTGYTITTEYTGDDSSLTPMVRVLEMFGVGFYIEFGASGGLRDLSGSMDSSGKIEFDIPADDSIYTVLMYMKNSDGDIEPGSETNKIFLKDLASESKIDKAMWIGIGYMLIVIAVLYFMILFSTYLIRSRVNKTRD